MRFDTSTQNMAHVGITGITVFTDWVAIKYDANLIFFGNSILKKIQVVNGADLSTLSH